MMNTDDRVFVAGHEGLTGSAILRRLEAAGYSDVLTGDGLDPTDESAVLDFFMEERPAYVFLTSARLGGIRANLRQPAQLMRDNLRIQGHIIHSAWRSGVRKLLFLASSCIYPKHCPQPIREEYLMTGRLEPTNQPYAVAKIAGVTMCQAYNGQYGTRFIPVVPADVYGPGDDFDPETGHFLAGLLARMHEATADGADRVVVWGTGTPRRECLHVDDLADACLFLMDSYNGPDMVNVGTGRDHSIGEVARLIRDIVGYGGEMVFDRSAPDGAPCKLLDSSRIKALGWRSGIGPEEGIRQTYAWYLEHTAIQERQEARR